MYVVLELQKTGERISTLVTQHDTLNEAKSKFFAILSVAAGSPLDRHYVSILTEKGQSIMNDGFDHNKEVE